MKLELFFAALLFLATPVFFAACAKHYDHKNQADDIALIARNLSVSKESIVSERLPLDEKYRNWYCVYFIVNGINESTISQNLKSYAESSQEKESLYLHGVNYKYLKELKWGPIEKYKDMQQYVGVWEKDYLVYIAVSGSVAYGYFENRYDQPLGAGPF